MLYHSHHTMIAQLGLTVVANLAATAEGAAIALKSPLLAKTEQQLHQTLLRHDGARVAALLELLVNLAAHAEGQKQLLRAASAPGQLPSPRPPKHVLLIADVLLFCTMGLMDHVLQVCIHTSRSSVCTWEISCSASV